MFLASGSASGNNELLFNDEYLCAEIGQVGTQLDGLGHVGKQMRMEDGSEVDVFYNGVTLDEMQSRYGLRQLGIEKMKPYITRGILIDVFGSQSFVFPEVPDAERTQVHDLSVAYNSHGQSGYSVRPDLLGKISVDAPVKLLCISGRGCAQDHQQQQDFQPNDSSGHGFLFIDVASSSKAA